MGNIPDNCNGLALIDESKDFCKHNCQWVHKNQGRPTLEKVKPPPKTRKRSGLKNPKTICLVLEKDHIDFIRQQALQKSLNEGSYIEANELIREALQKAFPTGKQFDMFGDRK